MTYIYFLYSYIMYLNIVTTTTGNPLSCCMSRLTHFRRFPSARHTDVQSELCQDVCL